MQFFDNLKGQTTYNGKNLKNFMENLFQLKCMNESIRQLLIPAFDLKFGNPVWFDSHYGQDKENVGQNDKGAI